MRSERRSRSTGWIFVFACLLPVGCSSLSSYRFGPSPQTQELLVEGEDTPFARAQVSSLGIARDAQGALAMHFRFRVRNPGEEPIRIRTDAFELVDAALRPFGAARVFALEEAAPAGLEVGPGAAVLFDVAFPFPGGAGPGDLQLDGVSLEWRVRTSQREYTANLYFARLVRVYAYDPWYSFHVGVGYTWH